MIVFESDILKILKKISFIILMAITSSAFSQNQWNQEYQEKEYLTWENELNLTSEDLLLFPQKDINGKIEGFHLFIRKKGSINSVLLCETTKDPDGKANNYSYRALEYNPINGDEIRLLDGKPLVSEGAKYSLIDSTEEFTDFLGDAFHIYIPRTLQYGYAWTRNDIVTLESGTFINLRTFEKPYGDYTGRFKDNPFLFDVRKFFEEETAWIEEEPVSTPFGKDTAFELVMTDITIPEEAPPEEENIKIGEPEEKKDIMPPSVVLDGYNLEANDAFKRIANPVFYSTGPDTLIAEINKVFDDMDEEKNADVVFAIDATGSMRNDIGELKKSLVPALIKKFENFKQVRFGLVFYRDYGEDFNYKNLPVRIFKFTKNYKTFQQNLNKMILNGGEGGDIPEAVYEALYASIEFFDWEKDSQKTVLLIGDAQPHPVPRGTGEYTEERVRNLAEERNIHVEAILLPEK